MKIPTLIPFRTCLVVSVSIKPMFLNKLINNNYDKNKLISFYFVFDKSNEDKSTDAFIYFWYFATDLIRTQCRELR